MLSLFLIIYFSFLSQKKISEDFYLKYSPNPYVSKGYHQLLGIPVPNDCPSCQSCPTIIYKNANLLGNFNMSPWNMRDSSLARAKWIWNIPNAEYNAPVNVWFYFAFYTDIVTTLTLSVVTDNVGTLYQWWMDRECT